MAESRLDRGQEFADFSRRVQLSSKSYCPATLLVKGQLGISGRVYAGIPGVATPQQATLLVRFSRYTVVHGGSDCLPYVRPAASRGAGRSGDTLDLP